jgi:hypothetical protein
LAGEYKREEEEGAFRRPRWCGGSLFSAKWQDQKAKGKELTESERDAATAGPTKHVAPTPKLDRSISLSTEKLKKKIVSIIYNNTDLGLLSTIICYRGNSFILIYFFKIYIYINNFFISLIYFLYLKNIKNYFTKTLFNSKNKINVGFGKSNTCA